MSYISSPSLFSYYSPMVLVSSPHERGDTTFAVATRRNRYRLQIVRHPLLLRWCSPSAIVVFQRILALDIIRLYVSRMEELVLRAAWLSWQVPQLGLPPVSISPVPGEPLEFAAWCDYHRYVPVNTTQFAFCSSPSRPPHTYRPNIPVSVTRKRKFGCLGPHVVDLTHYDPQWGMPVHFAFEQQLLLFNMVEIAQNICTRNCLVHAFQQFRLPAQSHQPIPSAGPIVVISAATVKSWSFLPQPLLRDVPDVPTLRPRDIRPPMTPTAEAARKQDIVYALSYPVRVPDWEHFFRMVTALPSLIQRPFMQFLPRAQRRPRTSLHGC